jgi:hypothetical protein
MSPITYPFNSVKPTATKLLATTYSSNPAVFSLQKSDVS